MISFLTILYIGVLALLVKFKIIRLTLFWKLSPLLWALLLFVLLFIPLQWAAPAGNVTMYQTVVEIIPSVSGEVSEVTARPLVPMKTGDVIFKIDPVPYQAKLDQLNANLQLAEINLQRAKKLFKRGAAAKYDFDRYTAEAKSLRAQVRGAKWDLDKTIVRAPSDGYVLGLTLQSGQRVSNLPLRSWVAFVDQSNTRLLMGVNQNLLRHAKQGHDAEVTFKLLPGQVFKAKVVSIVYMTSAGQLQPSGSVPLAPTGQEVPMPYGVVLELEDNSKVNEILSLTQLPGGAIGTGAIYTDSGKLTHIIRRIMIRMDAWLNFINPY